MWVFYPYIHFGLSNRQIHQNAICPVCGMVNIDLQNVQSMVWENQGVVSFTTQGCVVVFSLICNCQLGVASMTRVRILNKQVCAQVKCVSPKVRSQTKYWKAFILGLKMKQFVSSQQLWINMSQVVAPPAHCSHDMEYQVRYVGDG